MLYEVITSGVKFSPPLANLNDTFDVFVLVRIRYEDFHEVIGSRVRAQAERKRKDNDGGVHLVLEYLPQRKTEIAVDFFQQSDSEKWFPRCG